MRILLLSNWFPPVLSGSSFYTSSLARSLARRGHAVAVATLDWGPQFQPAPSLPFAVHRLPVLRIPKLPLFYNLDKMGFAFTPSNVRRLQQIAREHRAELLHHVNHIFDTTFLSIRVAHSLRIPIVGSITTPIQHQNPLKQTLMAAADVLTVGMWGVRRWDGIVSLDSVVHEEYVGKLYGRKTLQRSRVIPFGVRLETMDQYDDSSSIRAPHPQILFVGHIHPFRNPVQLIRAMPLVLQQVPDAQLVLAGRVDLQEPVRVARALGLTPDQVTFLGETPHEKILQLMKTSHVHASWATGPYRGLGTAPMEAMLCQTPVINDLPENLFGEAALRNGDNIVLVNSRDPQSIADAIIRLLKDEELRQRIGAAGRRFVLEHLNWDRIAEQMERFYAEVLERFHRRA